MAKEGKTKKPFYKKWWFWVIVVIIVAGAIGSNGGNDDSAKDSKDSKSATASTASSPKKEAASKKKYKIGDTVKVGDMQYKVTKTSTAKKIGPSALQQTANGTFLVIDLNVKNNGNEAVTVDSSFFNLKLGSKTYKADADASMSANQKEDGSIDNSFFMQDLNPGSEMSGRVVFDVPEDVANSSDLKVQVQTGAFGTETENINLK